MHFLSSKTGVYIFPPIDLKYTKLQKKGFKIYLRKSINFKFNIHPCKQGWVGVGTPIVILIFPHYRMKSMRRSQRQSGKSTPLHTPPTTRPPGKVIKKYKKIEELFVIQQNLIVLGHKCFPLKNILKIYIYHFLMPCFHFSQYFIREATKKLKIFS